MAMAHHHTDMAPETLAHLDTFAIAAERSSFTAAARELGLTQAAVSQRIAGLERELGVPLFRRAAGRVELTDAGRRLHEYARRILDLHREARREVSGRETPVAGDLLIAASSVPGEYLLPALLAAFGRKYPQVRVRAAVGNSAAVIEMVERGEVSVGLVGRKADSAHLEFRYLATDRMVLVIPPAHPLSRKKAVTVNQLAAQPLVLREAGSGLRHCFEKSLEQAGRLLTELRVVLELGSNEAIKEAVHRGVGVAVLSVFAVQKELDAGGLRVLEFKDIHCDREMFVVNDRRRVLPLPARLFMTFLATNPLPGLAH
jgi:DNA-binding transcriptional LysR family regulator